MAFIPGLGLSEQSPVVLRVSVGFGGVDGFLWEADVEEEMELVIDIDVDEAE